MDYSINILVVDDMPTSRVYFKRTLKKLGFNNVVAVGDGMAALDEYKENEFDLVIADWMMPNMDGLALFRALNQGEFLKRIPFIMVSVEKEKERIVEALRTGIDHYILKPVEPEQLEAKIKEVWGEMVC
jgi:two-component system chemotaxis response regulator CheY